MEPIEHLEERRASVVGATSAVKTYVILAVAVAIVTMILVVILAVLDPDDYTSAVATIIGVASPLIMALLGGGLHGMATAMDGKLSQIVRATAEKERALGVVEGLKENPNTNIE